MKNLIEVDIAIIGSGIQVKWVSLIRELNLEITSDGSYVGFDSENDDSLWTASWAQSSLPFKKIDVLPEVLKKSRGVSFYSFPHMLFSGQELINKLAVKPIINPMPKLMLQS